MPLQFLLCHLQHSGWHYYQYAPFPQSGCGACKWPICRLSVMMNFIFNYKTEWNIVGSNSSHLWKFEINLSVASDFIEHKVWCACTKYRQKVCMMVAMSDGNVANWQWRNWEENNQQVTAWQLFCVSNIKCV